MRYLSGKEERIAKHYIEEAAIVAENSTCFRAKCGAVIVYNEEIIGRGFNSPPGHLESQRRCHLNKEEYDKKVTDKTCCIHAEQRAIVDALINNPLKIYDARMYFARLNDIGVELCSKEPYCTICSKFALDVGLSEFILLYKEGIRVYSTEEYNNISFMYGQNIDCAKQ